jgi:hypothetical protein
MRISHARGGNSISLDSRTVFKPGCDGEKQVLAGFVEKKEAYIEAFSFGHNSISYSLCLRSKTHSFSKTAVLGEEPKEMITAKGCRRVLQGRKGSGSAFDKTLDENGGRLFLFLTKVNVSRRLNS